MAMNHGYRDCIECGDDLGRTYAEPAKCEGCEMYARGYADAEKRPVWIVTMTSDEENDSFVAAFSSKVEAEKALHDWREDNVYQWGTLRLFRVPLNTWGDEVREELPMPPRGRG